MHAILIMLHCESNTGYAIGRLEPVFYRLALQLCDGDSTRVHFSYPSMQKGKPNTLPAEFENYCVVDPTTKSPEELEQFQAYLARNQIDTVFGFDQPPNRASYRYMRKAGVRHFVSYWGAPMSSIFGPFKRLLKRIDVLRYPFGPDHYIFESQGMADTAIYGRGISAAKVDVVYLAVDTEKFKPNPVDRTFVYNTLNIDRDRKIFFYSGHMEERKGVHVLLKAAKLLFDNGRRDFHLLILGNKNGEESAFAPLLEGAHSGHITFGGYRSDLPQLHRGCFAGLIGSTGWDSLTCSALEMAASALPLLVSDLPGLRETVIDGETGYTFPAGAADVLASKMAHLMNNPELARTLGSAGRERALKQFSIASQSQQLLNVMRKVISRKA